MRSFRISLFIVAGCAVAAESYGQPSWQFTRLDDMGVSVFAEENSIALFTGSSDEDQAAGDILVNIATNASASQSIPDVGSAFAQSTSMAQAMNLTPVGSTTFAPTVDTTVSNSSIATATTPGDVEEGDPLVTAESRFPWEGEGVKASSNGLFSLEGAPTSGFLQGSMYLFGAVTGTESATGGGSAIFEGAGSVQATIEDYSVSARYNGFQWLVNVSLPDVTESFFTPSLNLYFNFTIPVTLPGTINLNANSWTNAYSSAAADGTVGSQSGTAQGTVDLSAGAWAVFTPTIAPTPDGDFDGDGDVDGSDFLTFQRGFGENMGATLTQGDADHDGNVDSADLALWGGNFGTMSFSSTSATLAVPEPATSAIAMTAILLVFSRVRSHRVPQP